MGQQILEDNDFPFRCVAQVDVDGGQGVTFAWADKAKTAWVKLCPMGRANEGLAIARQKPVREGFERHF